MKNGIRIIRECLRGLNSNMYIVVTANSEFGEAIIVDPCKSDELQKLICEQNIKSIKVLLTHEHFDHISGVNYLREICSNRIELDIICNSFCAENIKHPNKNLSLFWDILIANLDESDRKEAEKIKDINYSCQADNSFDDEFSFEFNNIPITLKSAPGHSEGGMLIYIGDEIVFTGDNLINGNGVICRWPGGSKKIYQDITKPMLENLSDSIIVFPGHGDSATKEALIQYTEMYKRV